MRDKIVAGNWKMNVTVNEAKDLAKDVFQLVEQEVNTDVKVILCTPFIDLHVTGEIVENSAKIYLGAQNCYTEESGAYTGEISASMLKSAGVEYVILGHSERREYFNEDNAMLKEKVDIVLKHEMIPIFCCGETLELRESGEHIDFVKNQITESLFHLDAETIKKVIVAYEPIWAIGTGKTASTEQAQEMHHEIRSHIAGKYSDAVAQEISILYGGSCKPGNAPELFACEDVDGGLIGGASLKSRDFTDIILSF